MEADRPRTFTMAYWPWLLPIMLVAGAGPSTARIAIEGDLLRVKMGWFWFRATVRCDRPRAAVGERLVLGGIHTDMMRGWIVNGSPLGWCT